MSMDAGGLAQMTYNTTFNSGLGIPGSGFASRGKGSHIKRLSVPPPPKISTIDETQPIDTISTPRTSRSHLLAGLRTAPKSATIPPTAPLSQTSNRLGLESSKYAGHMASYSGGVPQTATGATFPDHRHGLSLNSARQMYSLPEQVLAPPLIDMVSDEGEEPMDGKLYNELMATNIYLAQQQQRLQQQLINVTAAAQQFQGLNLNVNVGLPMGGQQQFQSPISPNISFYNQQLQQGVQPIISAVPNQPGVYSVYNPMTGQQSFVVDNNAQQQESPPPAYQELAQSPPPPATPAFRAQVSPPPETHHSPMNGLRARSPPKTTSSPPQDVNPLPPPSANAFRRGHKKSLSLANDIKINAEATKFGGPKSAGFPQTPLTGTFGPGQGRAGEHPIRQPRGPPSLEELVAKPTSKHEGSKNFVTRQRRRAVHNLVRAGIERRGESRTTASGSGGSVTPASEGEFTFSVSSSDNDDVLGSGSLSSKPSLGSLRAAANGAIGSERKEKSRERGSMGSQTSSKSVSGDENPWVGGRHFEMKTDEVNSSSERRKTPMLVLSSAEKRKSSIM